MWYITITEMNELVNTVGIGSLIFSAGPVARAVFFVLVLFSVISWTIIFKKWRQLKGIEVRGDSFISEIKGSGSLDRLTMKDKDDYENPFLKLLSIARKEAAIRAKENQSMNVETIMAVKSVMQAVETEETTKLEKRLSFLATTANAAPFIGLFGTVWGIMDSFREIGAKGTTSLAVVAPGISEALVATAIGLATAIPAVLAYNYFMGRLKGITSKMENASIYILNQLTR
ncbi:MAG: Tol-Pal system subunit TolQ [Syntrophus sp. (in: bacteria)]|nr:Tol-Pal system subunit TolQ [Syntrophus sp. (in: bacteria)]